MAKNASKLYKFRGSFFLTFSILSLIFPVLMMNASEPFYKNASTFLPVAMLGIMSFLNFRTYYKLKRNHVHEFLVPSEITSFFENVIENTLRESGYNASKVNYVRGVYRVSGQRKVTIESPEKFVVSVRFQGFTHNEAHKLFNKMQMNAFNLKAPNSAS